MQKRKIESEDQTEDRRKIQRTSTHKQDIKNNVNLPYLPIEIIGKIVTSLTNFKDIKTCMELSKDINNYLLRTPKIINNLEFNFNCIIKSDRIDSMKFLKAKGKIVKNMKISYTSEGSEILRTSLSQTPNLVEFSFDNAPPDCICCGNFTFSTEEQDKLDYWTQNPDSIDLPKLKVLEIEAVDLYNFLKITNQVKTLEKLTIYIHASNHQKVMIEFILQQKNLKELNLIVTGTVGEIKFLSTDISNAVKFKLTKLKMFTKNKKLLSEFLDKFLLTQVDSLEEIDFDFAPQQTTLDILYNKAKKFKKLTNVRNN